MQTRKLLIIWSTAELAVAKKLVLLYSSVMMDRNYWDEAHLMIWGPSAKILAQKEELQEMVANVAKTGVELSACVTCTDDYGVTKKFKELGIPTVHTGEFMTKALQNDWKVITF